MKYINLLFVLLLSSTLMAQTPSAFKYQAVARDASGNPIVNQNIGFKIGILEGSSSGILAYEEMHIVSSNDKGLVNLEIGNGAILSGDFGLIEWTQNEFFLEISMDETGGTNYQLMGTSQLLSVPYALAAYETETVPDSIEVYSVEATEVETDNIATNVVYIDSLLSLEPLTSAPPNPLKGDVYFDDNNSTLRLFDGTDWQDMKHQGNIGPTFINPVQIVSIFMGNNTNWQTAYVNTYVPSTAKGIIILGDGVDALRKDSTGPSVGGLSGERIIPITNIGTFEFIDSPNSNNCNIHLIGYF